MLPVTDRTYIVHSQSSCRWKFLIRPAETPEPEYWIQVGNGPFPIVVTE